jgi:hypothetical protein
MKRFHLVAMALLVIPAVVYAAGGSDDERGWSFSQRFLGTSNAAGVVLKENPSVGYWFNNHVELYGGVPFYFTRQSASSTTSGTPGFVNGVGNAFTGLLISANPESWHYSSNLVMTAPTGDKSRGFSTGHATADWTNVVSHPFTSFTPYGSIGIGNTVSDTEFFVRPFTTEGIVAHFEGGALMKLTSRLSAGASAYAVQGAGQQEIVSKVVETPLTQPTSTSSTSTSGQGPKNGVVSQVGNAVGSVTGKATGNGNGNADNTSFETTHETVTTSTAVNDHGVSTWLSFKPNSMTDFQVGYSRSVSYQLSSLFFGVGFHVGH